jgi:hypothetical protein
MPGTVPKPTSYPELKQLFGAYLHQDYQLFGDTLEEVIETYIRDSSPGQCRQMLDEIARFRSEHSANLDTALATIHGTEFDPSLWGLTAESFLKLLESMLQTAPFRA